MNFTRYRRYSVRNAALVCGFNQFQSLVPARELLPRRLLNSDYLDYLLTFRSPPRHSAHFSVTPDYLSGNKNKGCFLHSLRFELEVKLQR